MNLIIANRGGIAAVTPAGNHVLPLPVAGIMSADDAFKVGNIYGRMDDIAKELGSQLSAPYMTLSFMALLVIPAIKLSDRGLFDGETFAFLDVFS